MVAIVVAIFTSGCASHLAEYGGKTPDFSLSGEAAKSEIRRFRLEEDALWSCGPHCFENDPQERMHTSKSMLPLLESVSPESVRKYHRAETWGKVQLYSLGVGLVGLALATGSDRSQRQMFAKLSLLGSITSIGSGFYAAWIHASIPETYNRDLEQKFTPTIGLYWPLR